MIVPLYHTLIHQQTPPLRPAYECYILFIIYTFLPLTQHIQCVVLGALTTGCYLIEMSLITYRHDEQIASKCVTEFIFLLCVNFFGFYFRMMNEVAIRRAFLDRRECVEGNMLLKLARDQEVSTATFLESPLSIWEYDWSTRILQNLPYFRQNLTLLLTKLCQHVGIFIG